MSISNLNDSIVNCNLCTVNCLFSSCSEIVQELLSFSRMWSALCVYKRHSWCVRDLCMQTAHSFTLFWIDES